MTSGDARRVNLQPAFVLHQRPYRDTSRILELFTRDHGRVTVFARGARGARKAGASLAAVLQPFNRLLASWSGRGEAGQLVAAEFDGPVVAMPAASLVNGFYLNELLLKLFARHDAHPDVFDLYERTLDQLKRTGEPLRALRIFEKRLLDSLGYGLALEREVGSGQDIDPQASYYYRLEQGAVLVGGVAESAPTYSGATLLSLGREELHDAQECSDARRLLRAALDRCLEGRQLNTREVMLALRRHGRDP